MNFDCIDLFTLSVKLERSCYFIHARRISSANNFFIGVSIKTVKLRHRHVIRKVLKYLPGWKWRHFLIQERSRRPVCYRANDLLQGAFAKHLS